MKPGSSGSSGGGASYDSVGKFGSAFKFDGGYFITCDAPITIGTSPFTIEFWFKQTTPTASKKQLCGTASQNGLGPNQFVFGFDDNNKLALYIGGSTTPLFTTTASPTVVTGTTWYHIALVRDASGFRVYFNGSSLATNAPPSTAPVLNIDNSISQRLCIGGSGIGCSYTECLRNCSIDEFRVTVGTARYIGTIPVPTAVFPGLT